MKITQCMNCMEDNSLEETACPHCGFVESENPALPHQLPYRSVLNGKYLVGRAIGEGGFGITYIGWDLNLGYKVAIKEFYPDGFVGREGQESYTVRSYQGDSTVFFNEGKEKFLDEARRLGQFMQLPGIVSVKDFFLENNTVYIVMEFLEGISLKEYAKEHDGHIEQEELLKVMKPVIESLIEVHKNGIIHRDISPDNIMMCKDGQVKLIDFGAAREASPEGNKTMSVMLKKGYSPEEQYRTHGEQGTWTDVYALSATIYALLTGFKPDEPLDRLENDTLKRPSELGIHLTRRQEDVLMKGLAVKACDRVQTMDELLRGLYFDGKENEFAMKKSGKGTKIAIYAAAAVGALIIAVLAGVLWYVKVPAKTGTVLCLDTQVNSDLTIEDIREYLPDTAENISFSMDGSLSESLFIQGLPEEGDSYKLNVRYDSRGRTFIQPLELSVLVPTVNANVELLTCETGKRIADYTRYFTTENADNLELVIEDDTDNSVSGEQYVYARLQNGGQSIASAGLCVKYFDMEEEENKLLALLHEYSGGRLSEDEELKQCADKFMEEAVNMDAAADWNEILDSCSQAVINTYPNVSYTEALAIPIETLSDENTAYEAETFYNMLTQDAAYSEKLKAAEGAGIAAHTVYGEEKTAVYWCIYYR